ncbi:MAG: T9SS type A sorting domain-containing protein, partial [Bacteroidia bacterium]
IDPYHWYQVFTWDGFNEFWSGRPANGTKHYPQALVNEVHADGEIWCAVMMEIWGLVGKNTTDKIMYESLYSWSNNMTMPDAALLVIQADSLLTGGANFFNLCDRFTARGLYTGACTFAAINELGDISNPVQLLNTNDFANGTGNLIINLNTTEKNVVVNINDVTGREINSFNYSDIDNIEISPAALSKGIYFITINTPDQKITAKVLRVN